MPFDFDVNVFAINGLPPNKRLPKWIVFIQACISALTRKWGIFQDYYNGSSYDAWNSTFTYVAKAKVWYNYSVYESYAAGNFNNNPLTSPNEWELINASFMGASVRANINGNRLCLTWGLNTYFQKALAAQRFFGFRQSPWPGDDYGSSMPTAAWPSIYITNVALAYASFLSFATEPLCTPSFTTSSGNYDVFTIEKYNATNTYTFAINIPLAVYNSLGSINAIRNVVIGKFVNLYITSGTGYIIQTY